MTYRVISMPGAQAEAEAAFLWIWRDSPASAFRWQNGLEDAIDSLERFPERCPLAPESDVLEIQVRQLLYKSHRVLFVIDAKTVYVLHVRHAARGMLGTQESGSIDADES
jgi:plasmid stabilization system protein ParE